MSIRGKEVRPLLDADMHERLSIMADFEGLDIAALAARLLEQAIAGEWFRFDRLIKQSLLIGKKTAPAEESPAGFVYIVRIGERYKIGKTVDWQKRISNAMFPEPPEVICVIETDNHHDLERSLHEKYSEVRLHGEWFGLSTEQVEDIKKMPGATSPE